LILFFGAGNIFPTEARKRFGIIGEMGGAQKKLKWIYTKGVEAIPKQ